GSRSKAMPFARVIHQTTCLCAALIALLVTSTMSAWRRMKLNGVAPYHGTGDRAPPATAGHEPRRSGRTPMRCRVPCEFGRTSGRDDNDSWAGPVRQISARTYAFRQGCSFSIPANIPIRWRADAADHLDADLGID